LKDVRILQDFSIFEKGTVRKKEEPALRQILLLGAGVECEGRGG
jgi:hypothetical protein